MSMATSTQTETDAKTAAALTARPADAGQQQGQVAKLLSHIGDGQPLSGSRPPWGHIPHQGSGSGSGGGGGGGGGGGSSNPGGGAAGGSNDKLGGNPPAEFNGDHVYADTFLNEFSLYCITNIDVEQMANPRKCAALFLGFIKGENVKDWVKKWINWILNQITAGRPTGNEYYWTQVHGRFQQAFQDMGARERAEDKLCHLAFTPGEIDKFVARFKLLAEEATYPLDAQLTLTLFVSKLPYKMMDHILKVVRPHNFHRWKDRACQYHRDNVAVQNIRGISDEIPQRHFNANKMNPSRFTLQQWAKILGVKMPQIDPNMMDTWADSSCQNNRGQKTRGQATIVEAQNPDTET